MKKILAGVICLLMVFTAAVNVYADAAAPVINDWYVVCGPQGYEKDGIIIEPGTECLVLGYDIQIGGYHLKTKDVSVSVTDADFERLFIEVNETVSPEDGQKLDSQVKFIVSQDDGVDLRQGPADGFRYYDTVPKGTELKYQYTMTFGNDTWCYTSYMGIKGWCLVSEASSAQPDVQDPSPNSAENTVNAANGAENTTNSASMTFTNENTTNAENVVNAANTVQEPNNNQTGNTSVPEKPESSNTSSAVLIAVAIAVVIAVIAILILVKTRKKNDR